METLRLDDGRSLAFRVFGPPLQPHAMGNILYFHGVPSCHMEAEALHEAAEALGLSLSIVSMDRPGMGLSDFCPGRTLETTARDARQLARHLRMEGLVLVGTSGGGPYAAAFAALYPEAVDCLVLVSAVGPTDWGHLPLLRAMQGADGAQFWLARLPPLGGLWALHWALGYMARNHAGTLLQHAPEGMAAADGEALRGDGQLGAAFARCLQHAYCRGSRGLAHDVRVLGGKWSIDFSEVQCRTHVWQGEEDRSVPVEHARWWAQRLPGSTLHLLPGEGHITVLLRCGGAILRAALQLRDRQQEGAGASPAAAPV